ncbi:MAG: U32 family peptidase [Lachnospiraceae bacterium]|nr:U32 family peptidase [Lachnospiraceae bacterium]
MDRQLEVLAPAGDLEILKTAVLSGATGVYFGGEEFGARAYATNFSFKEACAGIDFAHKRGARTYLTVNTLLKSIEIEKKVYSYLKDYYNAGIDAVLVQDIGLMQLVREYFPELHLHISTQANVTSEYGAAFFKELGAKRVVLARELSLKEIERIHKAVDIELECFAHGALCVSYSGQCLMSSMIGGRSGNRGRCAQPCRKCYRLLDQKGDRIRLPGRYPLSMKDLITIDHVAELYRAGCSSLKIEGRMKSKEYVARVVSSYRWAADAAMSGQPLSAGESEALYNKAIEAGSRAGGCDGYLSRRNGPEMISFANSSFSSDGPAAVSIALNKTRAKAFLHAKVGEDISLELSDQKHTVRAFGPVIEKARKEADISDEIREKIRRSGDDRIEITDVGLDIDRDAFIPVSLIKRLRREAVDKLLGGLVQSRNEPLPFKPMAEKRKRIRGSRRLLVSCLSKEQLLSAGRILSDDDIIALDYDLYSRMDMSVIRGIGAAKYLCLPHILRSDKLPQIDDGIFDGLIVSSFDEMQYASYNFPDLPMILDQRVYSWSDRSRSFLLSKGAAFLTAPYELNEKELSHLDNSSSFITVYGRTPVMYTATCQHKNSRGCDRRQEELYLLDERKSSFLCLNFCSSCTNVIYNSLPTSLLPFLDRLWEMGFAGVRVDLTVENEKETVRILQMIKNNKCEDVCQATRGHFHRGVS